MISLRDQHERLIIEINILQMEAVQTLLNCKLACLQKNEEYTRNFGYELVAIRQSTQTQMEERVKILNQLIMIDRAMECNNYMNITL